MNIIELEYRGPPALGGVETVVLEISKQFKKRGHNVEIWSSDILDDRGKRDDKKESFADGIVVKKFRSYVLYKSSIFSLVFPFFSEIYPEMFFHLFNLKNRDIIIHSHSFPNFHTLFSLLLHKKFKKVIITPHFDADDLTYFVSSFFLRKLTLTILKHFVNRKENVYLTAITNLEKDVYVKKLRFKESKVKVNPNGVNTEEFDTVTNEDISRIKEKYRLENKFVVLFVGRVAQIKGIDTLIRAISILSNENIILIVAGPDFGAVTALQSLVKKLDLEEKIVFTGELERKELRTLIKCCDVLVLPSRGGEAFGIVLAEAMVCGKPVIGSRTGGIPEIVKEGVNGFLFDVNNVEQLSEKISALLLNKELRVKFGENGRQTVKANYTWEKVANDYLRLMI